MANTAEDAAQEIENTVDEATRGLSDVDYVEALEILIGNLQVRVDVKKSEME